MTSGSTFSAHPYPHRSLHAAPKYATPDTREPSEKPGRNRAISLWMLDRFSFMNLVNSSRMKLEPTESRNASGSVVALQSPSMYTSSNDRHVCASYGVFASASAPRTAAVAAASPP